MNFFWYFLKSRRGIIVNEHIDTSKLLRRKERNCAKAEVLYQRCKLLASVQSTPYFLFRYENLSGKTMSRSKLVERFQHHKSTDFRLETALHITRFQRVSPPVLRSIRASMRAPICCIVHAQHTWITQAKSVLHFRSTNLIYLIFRSMKLEGHSYSMEELFWVLEVAIGSNQYKRTCTTVLQWDNRSFFFFLNRV